MPVLCELVLEAPLILPERGWVQLQVSVGELDESGRRSLGVHSHPQEASARWCCLRRMDASRQSVCSVPAGR